MRIARFLILCLVLIPALTQAQDSDRLLRFPTLHGNRIVFSYGGDLYAVPRSGGTATQLTDAKGYETFPRFSPDGEHLAFSGVLHGNREVYVMPAAGGEPERLTYTATLDRDDVADRMGPNNVVMTWTPDSKEIIYRSRRRSFNAFKGKLNRISVEGGMSEELPFSVGSWCSYSPDGQRLAMNWVFREFRTWKYYRGGMADDIRIFDFENKSWEQITTSPAQDIFPMWHGETIYFASDRNRRMNLYAYDLNTEEIRQVTDFEDFDVKFPSLGSDAILFENGGYLYLLNLQTEKTRRIDVQIPGQAGEDDIQQIDGKEFIGNAWPSPDGKRLGLTARGEVFTLPAQEGVTRRLTHSSGAHERALTWSPDGAYLAYLSDQTGEFEIFVQKQDGSEEPIQITKNADTYKYHLRWSPDAEKLLWADKKLRLRMVDVESGDITEVAQATDWEYSNYEFSPDGQWIAYTEQKRAASSRIHLYNVESGRDVAITEMLYNSGGVHFSRDGKYLFFVSNRDFKPIYSQTEWNHAYRDMSRIYLIPLAKETPSPLAPENDEVTVQMPGQSSDDGGSKSSGDDGLPEVKVDLDGITQRIIQLPVSPGNYGSIEYTDGVVYYTYSKQGDDKPALKMFDLEKEEEKELGKVDGFQLSHDGKRMLVVKDKKYFLIDRPASSLDLKEPIDMEGLKFQVNRPAEYRQIYFEAWRQMRDFFYDPGMHGLDWTKMRDKYAELLPHVEHRNDLSYVIGELISELSIGHAYVGKGDRPEPERIKLGLLGARLSKHESGFFRIDSILNGANWNDKLRSPLTEPGVVAQEGWYITHVNGVRTDQLANLYTELIGKNGQLVELTINEEPELEGGTTSLVKPLADESELYYYNWVENNRRKVNRLSDGRIGYIHVPNMGRKGLNMFAKYFYPQLEKDALIIDDRGNGGGNVSPMLIERLQRTIAMTSTARNTDVYPNPFQTHVGPKTVLLDRYSASDGDFFPYRFRYRKLGKLIGERSWGGVVGIRGSLPFIDGGMLRKPEFASFSPDGKEWIIEGHGVEPDIRVVNDPYRAYAENEDKQLERAVEELKKEMQRTRTDLPEPPPFPDKSK